MFGGKRHSSFFILVALIAFSLVVWAAEAKANDSSGSLEQVAAHTAGQFALISPDNVIPYADEDFMHSLRDGLQERWAIPEPEGYSVDLDVTVQHSVSLFNIELEHLNPYREALFKDPKVKEMAELYIAAVDKTIDAVSYVTTDFNTFDRMATEAYMDRARVITALIDDYGIVFDNNFDYIIREFRTSLEAGYIVG